MKFRDPSTEGNDSDSDEELTELSLDPGAGYDSSGAPNTGGNASQQPSPAGSSGDRRAHHNMLERKRRDHIKDSFLSLKDSVPTLSGEKASRTQILRKACDYIESMRDKIAAHTADIAQLREQNQKLEAQVRGIEDAAKAMRTQAASHPEAGSRAPEVTGNRRPEVAISRAPEVTGSRPQLVAPPPQAPAGHDYYANAQPEQAQYQRIIRVSMPSGLLASSHPAAAAPGLTTLRLPSAVTVPPLQPRPGQAPGLQATMGLLPVSAADLPPPPLKQPKLEGS